jgi:hypothetical protein
MPIDPYRIAQAVKSDVPEMQQISLNAFLNDTHTLLKASEKGSPDISGELPGDAFYEWVDNEKMQVIKVLDNEGRMVGFSCWGFWNYDGSRTVTVDPSTIFVSYNIQLISFDPGNRIGPKEKGRI